MKKNLIFLSLLFPMVVSAAIYEKKVTGYGEDRESAIYNARLEGVRQFFGSELSSVQVQKLAVESGNIFNKAEVSLENGSSEDFKGRIAGYDILDTRCEDECEATLMIRFEKDDSKLEQEKLLTRKSILLSKVSGKSAIELRNDLQSKLVQGRKFAVVEDLMEGLDYSVELTVKDLKTTKNSSGTKKVDPLTGEVTSNIKTYYRSLIIVDYKVYRSSTGQVLAQDTIKTTSSRNNISLLKKITVDKLYHAIHGQIFPHRIAKVKGNKVIIASGGTIMKVGENYDVFSLSEKVFDPYTGELLGQEETKVSSIRITKVLPKMSYAVLIGDGQASEHDIVRKRKQEPTRKTGKTSSSKNQKKAVTEDEDSLVDKINGGVVL